MMTLDELQTPALILDRSRFVANVKRMGGKAARHGVRLRPHLKTAKSVEVARIVHALGGEGGAVSTLNEAEYFLRNGVTDLQYAVCLTPDKFARVEALVRSGARLTVITDSAAVVSALASYTEVLGVPVRAMLEIDCGEHRTGVLPDSDAVLEIARLLHAAPGITFLGVMTHGGHSYAHHTAKAIRTVAEDERFAVTHAAARIRAAGIPVEEVSLGSSPTVAHATDFEGVSEVRPGVYMFGDLKQAQMGVGTIEDIAVSVLATVISRQGARAVIDAGGLALSKDRSTAYCPTDYGYGLVRTAAGEPLPSNPILKSVHQEHGEMDLPQGCDFLRVGDRVRILPNHICMTAAMYDAYHVVDSGGREILEVWPRTNGWSPRHG